MAPKRKPAMPAESTRDAVMAFRLPTADRERLARVAALMGESAGGGPLPESYVARAALKRGLDAIEAELGSKSKR